MSSYKVLLINPPRINGFSWTREGRCQEKEDVLGTAKPPISLALIASLLRENNIKFKLVDATALDLSPTKVSNLLIESSFHPDVIIFCTTTATVLADTDSLSILKKKFNSKLIAFGAHISGAPKATLEKIPDIDIGIIGEPEYTALDLVQNFNLSNFNNVSGVVWRNGKEIFVNNRRNWIEDLNQLPQPAWDMLPIDKYVLPFINRKYLLIETSRGCPFACDFCVAPLIHGIKFREKRPETVVNEIEDLKSKYKIEYFYLFGDTVTLNKRFVNEFCEELIKRNLKIQWLTNTRADTLYDIELVKKMKESGCWMLAIGIESFNEKTRENMQKKLETDKITQAIRLLRETGILSFGFFIYGYPGETEKDMCETTGFACSLPLDYANFYPAVPYPGTAFYKKCSESEYLRFDSWDKMEYSSYIIETKDLNEAIVKKAVSRAYRSFYMRPKFIYRHIKNIGPMNFFPSSIKYGLKFLSNTLKNIFTK
ncbi:MAG: Anaerobic magnesium-protoporphyrin IX monomethyl ester cyclase, Elongator protein 3/MiaB/NifB family [Parcubacteria group bacterium GW2011_GWC2_39_14]|nr:MAG: Anaerobic magnesium-protoporphyrin IX monomethyl ester cyclase, Elongator protein 3/MiaB/NifB family [Parcubacteria group bacterium GW2011_GWC2_39_14]